MQVVVPFGLPAHEFEHQLGPIGLRGNNGIGTGTLERGHAGPQARRLLLVARPAEEKETIERADGQQEEEQHQRTTTNAHRSSVAERTAGGRWCGGRGSQ